MTNYGQEDCKRYVLTLTYKASRMKTKTKGAYNMYTKFVIGELAELDIRLTLFISTSLKLEHEQALFLSNIMLDRRFYREVLTRQHLFNSSPLTLQTVEDLKNKIITCNRVIDNYIRALAEDEEKELIT